MRLTEITDQPMVVTFGGDDAIDLAIRTMKDQAVRRWPVIDSQDLVGTLSQADIARALTDGKVSATWWAPSRSVPPTTDRNQPPIRG